MKKIERLLLFAVSLTFGFCCFSANTYAIEQAYLIEEPTITTDRDAGTIDVRLRFQNLRSGMSNLKYTLYVSDNNYTDPYSEYGSDSSCSMGSVPCEIQRHAVVKVAINETEAPETRIYKAKNWSFEDYLSGQRVSIDGELTFSLKDGIISNTIAVAPSTDIAASHTYLAEWPSASMNADDNTFSLPLSIINGVEGIKSARIYLTYLPSSGPMLPTFRRIDATRDCSDEASCQAEYKKPLTLDVTDDGAHGGRYTVRNLAIEYPNGSMREFGGQLTYSTSAGLSSDLDLPVAPRISADVTFHIDGDTPDGIVTPENGTYRWDGNGNNDLPTPGSTDDQIFSGWYTDDDFKNKIDGQTPSDDIDLYGKFIDLDHDTLDDEDTFNEWCKYQNNVLICVNSDNDSVSTGNTTNPTTPQVPSGIALDGATGEWVSDNPDVATVDQDGRITGVSEGSANIRFVIYDDEGNIIYEYVLPCTVKGADNPDTLDMLPIVITVAIFSAISLTGFVSKSIFGRR